MQKHTLFIAMLIVVCLSLALVACNDVEKDEYTVTFVTSGVGEIERHEKTVKSGATISLADFTAFQGDSSKIGNNIYTGLFSDSSCVFKRDDSQPITQNTVVYVKKSAEGTPIINFILNGEKFPLAVEKTKTVGVFDFITSAYGKSAIPEQFDFFKDEKCTEKIDLNGYSYKSYAFDFWQRCTIYVTKHPVSTIDFCIHISGGECTSSFGALVRTDEPLNASVFQSLYRAYFNNDAYTVSKAKFYSDSSLTIEVASAGELKKIHVNIEV